MDSSTHVMVQPRMQTRIHNSDACCCHVHVSVYLYIHLWSPPPMFHTSLLADCSSRFFKYLLSLLFCLLGMETIHIYTYRYLIYPFVSFLGLSENQTLPTTEETQKAFRFCIISVVLSLLSSRDAVTVVFIPISGQKHKSSHSLSATKRDFDFLSVEEI